MVKRKHKKETKKSNFSVAILSCFLGNTFRPKTVCLAKNKSRTTYLLFYRKDISLALLCFQPLAIEITQKEAVY